MLILFSKSQFTLFDAPVHVAASVRKDGTIVRPHIRIQKVAPKPTQQRTFLSQDEPAAKIHTPEKRSKFDAFLARHGGEEGIRSSLMEMQPHQRVKLIDAMAHADGVTPAEMMVRLGIHEEPSLFRPEESEATSEVAAPEHEQTVRSGPEIVEHVTRKGKTLRGVIRSDLNGHQAAAIDPYTFRKDGGWFIREKYLMGAGAEPAAEPKSADEPAEAEKRVEMAEAIDKSKVQAAKLREAGSKLKEAAEADLGRDRLANTARRARMAASADADARQRLSIAGTMMNLADAIASGDARGLQGITTRAAVETLDRMVRQAVYEADRHLPHAEQQKRKGRAPEPDDIRNATLPILRIHGSNALEIAEKLRGQKGASKLSAWAYKVGERVPRDTLTTIPESEYGMARDALKKLADMGDKHTGWQIRDRLATRDRLTRAGITNDHELRLALAEYLVFRDGPKKADPIKEAERALVGQKVGIDFFPTPKPLAAKMAELAGIEPGMTVLEPSAGNGHLADAARDAGGQVDTVEVSEALKNVLRAKGHTIAGSDFDEFAPGKQYDAVIMNPPFSDRRDAAHIMRAYDLLKPGGKLVAIAGEGVFFGSDKKAQAFRDWLDERGAEVEKLPENTFKGADLPAQTGANARLIVVEKPADAEAAPALADTGPKEGDTKVEDGVEYVLRDGRWHRSTPEPPDIAADEPATTPVPEEAPAAEPVPVAGSEPVAPQPDPELEEAEDREDLADELARNPHSEKAKKLVRKLAERIADRDEPVGTGAFDADDPSSPNYRYADTGHVAGSRKEIAASQVIKRAKQEGARVFATAIDWDQLEQNPREAKDLITKSNLFGEIDWPALRDAGMEPGAGFLIDRIYAAIGQEPSVDDPQARKDYALGLQTLRDRLERSKTPADVTDVLDNLREEYDGKVLTAEESARYQAFGEEARALHDEEREIRKGLDELYNEQSRRQADIYSIKHEIDNRKRRGWSDKPELEAQLAEAKTAYDAAHAAWADRLHATKDRRDAIDKLQRDLYGKRDAIILAAAVRNKLENPLHRAWNIMGDRFVNVLRYRSFKGSDAFAKHVTAAKTGKVADWSWAEKETVRTPRVTKESARFQMKVADAFERVGGRAVAPQSTADLKQMFGLRDVQSGNWVLRDVASAKFHTEHSAAAFADLADLMGVSDDHVALNGRLALAFGARGHGAKGWKDGAARAHYEAVHRIINLTKMGGGGTLAHEWFHALDNMAGEAEGGTSGVGDFFTENPDLLPSGELREAAKALRSAMLDGPHQASRTETYTAEDVRLAKRNIGGQFPGAMARMITSAGNVHDAVQAIERHFGLDGSKEVSRRSKRLAQDWRRIALAHYGGNPAGGEIVVRSGNPMSSFRLEAIKLDQGGSAYFVKAHEMAARAFQAWVEDRLSDQGRRNDYLSSLADNRYHVDPLFGIEWKPFPEGEERARINAAFDRLVAAMQASNTLAKAIEMLAA
jgi:protein-L-isoaspartate O-methyltransferase